MADIVLSPLLQVIFDRLASPMIKSLADFWSANDNLQKLQHTLSMVQAVLEDAEEQQVTNRAVRIWLSKLKDAVYYAEDLLDELAAKFVLREKSLNVNKVREVLQALETIGAEGLNWNFREGSVVTRPHDRRETGSFVIESEVFGREGDKEEIVKLLLSCEATDEGNASYITIIGMGGLGKTTLAQLAYNDEMVTRHFDTKIWVYVSHDFDVKKIMVAIIESASTEGKCHYSTLDKLQSEVWCLLHKKRYLIVLDDVWSEDQDEWDKLRPLFKGGVDGSKIIVTTRSKKVAFMMESPNNPYYLEGLPEDDCWALFKQRAFQRGEEDKYPYLLPIGKQIVKKCGGVPLAAKTLGSLMRFKREEREWLIVQSSELWNLDVCHSGILPALRLSYFHLPPHLKHCFSFCSIFPRSYEIPRKKLIHMWMAEGLIQSSGLRQPLEDIGDEYFADLVWMSFFQEVKQRDDGSVIGYRMHDIMHDLARSIAGKESRILELDHSFLPSSLAQTRHLSIVSDFRSSALPTALHEAKHLRTLLLFLEGDFEEALHKMLSRSKYLRVLDMASCSPVSLDESICGLMCLTYINLSYSHIRVLPRSFEKLCLLQTLNLYGCSKLRELPSLVKMINLSHLNVTGCEALTTMLPLYEPFDQLQQQHIRKSTRNLMLLSLLPPPRLSRFQTFPTIIVGGFADIQFLRRLNLHGELTIKSLENVIDAADVKDYPLLRFNIQSLALCWGNNYHDWSLNPAPETNVARFQERKQLQSSGLSHGNEPDATLGEQVIKGLKPHQNLKRLFVKGYPGIRFPHWKLPNLSVVVMSNCKKLIHLPTLGNLLQLKTLSVGGMHGVKKIGREFYCEGTERPFPSLIELVLIDFPNLEEWSSTDGRDAFPSLSKLIVNKCPNLTAMPLLLSLQHLELRDFRADLFSFIENLGALRTLVIEKAGELLSLPGGFLANNPLLTSLEIISCPKLRSLPSELGNLIALKSLIIRWCAELSYLPQGLQDLKALESLEIGDCHSIISMPEDGIGGLSSLRTLSIENCSNLTSLSTSLQQLTSLEHLTLMYCPSLVSLPEDVHHLSALRSLTILSCPEFLSLPDRLQYVTTLHCLEIRSCPGLTALPEWIKDLTSLRSLTVSDCHNLKQLPEGLKLLTALQHLTIQDCPEVEERCKQEIGEDWPKIVHVPHRYIGSTEVRQSTASSSSG